MDKAPNDLIINDVFLNILSHKLSDEDIRRIFTLHGEIQFPKSTNNAKKLNTEEQIAVNFKSRSHLLRTMAAICTKFEEIRKTYFLINDLPDECLLHIFSFLWLEDKLNIEKVCKRWRDISPKVFAGTKKLDLSYCWSTNIAYSIIKRCGPTAEILKLGLVNGCKNLMMAIESCQLDQLRKIHLDCSIDSRPNLYLSHLTKLLGKNKNLATLVMTGYVDYYDIDQILAPCLQSLEKLKIHNFGQQVSLRINLYQFPNLRKVRCANVRISKIQGPINPETAINFQSLELYGCKISRSFINKIKFCTNLRKICLNRNECQIDADDILDIVKNCQKIEKLQFNAADSMVITPQCFQQFSKLPSLESLRIDSLGDAGTAHLQHLTNLKELTIDDCTDLSDHKGLTQLITNSSKLSELNLFNVDTLDESFPEEIDSIFSSGLRVTPLTLKIQVECYNWGREYNHDFCNPLFKFKLIRDSSVTDSSEYSEGEEDESYADSLDFSSSS